MAIELYRFTRIKAPSEIVFQFPGNVIIDKIDPFQEQGSRERVGPEQSTVRRVFF